MAELADLFNGNPKVPTTAASDSLAGALNAFFNRSAKDGTGSQGDAGLKLFSATLDWISQGEALAGSDSVASSESEGVQPAADGYYHLDFSGAERARAGALGATEADVLGIVNYLRDALGNDNAADHLEDNWRSGASQAAAAAVAIVLKENGKAQAAELIARLNKDLAPAGVQGGGNGIVEGWRRGADYSLAAGDPGRYEHVLSPAEGGGFWFGDGNADDLLAEKGHQGLLLNFSFTDKATGAKLWVPLSYDLDEIYESWRSSRQIGGKVDAYA